MPSKDDIRWFKEQFQEEIEQAIAGTPFTVDHITALACQETGIIWPFLKKAGLSASEVAALCVGDTLDADKGRKAFPKTKAELIAYPRGQEMFELGHEMLVKMSKFVPGYDKVATMSRKFCHGYGVFQLDLQFFKVDPDFFLNSTWANFGSSLVRAMGELKGALQELGLDGQAGPLSDLDFAHVGIVYNTGGFKPAKGLKQGHEVDGRFYGEDLFDFVRICHTVATGATRAAIQPPVLNQAIMAAPTTPSGEGTLMRVETKEGMLRVRSEPVKSVPEQANVIANLPDGHPVRVSSSTAKNEFLEIETSLFGALIRGFSSKKFLVADADAAIEVVTPAAGVTLTQALGNELVTGVPGTSNILQVFMPKKSGIVIRRTANANAHTLNEKGQPTRAGVTPQELRESIAKIIEWLAVDNDDHIRYKPRDGLTFCNVYVHDFCFLGGAYCPRVWWTDSAQLKLAAGQHIEPNIGGTIREMRANDLFRWLRDFGPGFGWRQTGTLTKLQAEVNQGAMGVIVARRKEDGKSGHIVMVVPETAEHTAKRDSTGEVTAPLQSQAGASNFQYGRGTTNWWNGAQFAEFAFWIHA
jgi:hypothetical protein